MSDVQQADGWWLASDGKWYPPQSRPAALPPPPPPAFQPPPPPVPPPPTQGVYSPSAYPYAGYAPVPERRSVSSTLTGWLQGLMWATAGLAVVTALVAVGALVAFEDYVDSGGFGSSRRFDDWVEIDDALAGVSGIYVMVWIATFVLIVIWMFKSLKTLEQVVPGHRQWSPGWGIGGWFIPFANAVIPKLVFNQIERMSKVAQGRPATPGYPAPPAADWRAQSTAASGWLWWIFGVIGIVLVSIGNGLGEDILATDDEIRAGYVLTAIGSLTTAGALACGALYVRGMGKRLTRSALGF